MSILLAYIPVIHAGYQQLFEEYFKSLESAGKLPSGAATQHKVLYLIPAVLGQEFGPTHKDIHALDALLIKKSLESWAIFDEIEVLDLLKLEQLNSAESSVHIPDEVISREFVKKYLPDCPTTASSIFLRWNKENAVTAKEPQPDSTISAKTLQALLPENAKNLLSLAQTEGSRSSDWWRQVGAVAVRNAPDGNSKIIAQAHNTHLPSEQQPYIEGDGRAQFHKGEHIEATTAIHAEAKLIAEAARSGISLSEADLYVTDFPCPPCTKLVAAAGFKRVFYEKGYAVFDGERILTSAAVEIIQISQN